MESIPQSFLSVPLYIALPRHPVTRRKRHVLVHINLEHIRQTQVRLKTQWTVVYPLGPFQGDVESTGHVPPSIPGVTVFMPANPMANPVYIFVNHVSGRRIRPGLLVTVTVRHVPSAGPEGVDVDVTVGANIGSKVSYSGEVAIGDMMQMTDVDNGDLAVPMAEARRTFVEEMWWRGESLGPPDTPIKSEDEWPQETSCSRYPSTGAKHKSFGEAAGQSSTDAADEEVGKADLSSAESHGAELGVLATSGGADEHNIDDCYA